MSPLLLSVCSVASHTRVNISLSPSNSVTTEIWILSAIVLCVYVCRVYTHPSQSVLHSACRSPKTSAKFGQLTTDAAIASCEGCDLTRSKNFRLTTSSWFLSLYLSTRYLVGVFLASNLYFLLSTQSSPMTSEPYTGLPNVQAQSVAPLSTRSYGMNGSARVQFRMSRRRRSCSKTGDDG